MDGIALKGNQSHYLKSAGVNPTFIKSRDCVQLKFLVVTPHDCMMKPHDPGTLRFDLMPAALRRRITCWSVKKYSAYREVTGSCSIAHDDFRKPRAAVTPTRDAANGFTSANARVLFHKHTTAEGHVTTCCVRRLPSHSRPELTTLTPHGLMFPGPQLPETIPPHWPSALTELRGEYCTAIVTYNPLTPSLVPVLGPGFLSGTMADLWSVQSQCCIVPYRAV
ncbi:hypothetical protein J6590_000245 [Homalodisca vitripennis]|nr:hypothetical protein J6590_000245 [Homalodisca vitripennis]